MRSITFQPGEFVFRAGEPSLAVYVIEHGEIVIRGWEEQAAIDLVRLQDGDLFGESGVLEARPRSASAVAVSVTTVLETPGGDFLHAFGVDNEKALALLRLLCHRLRSTTRRAARAKADLAAALKPDAGPAWPPIPLRLIPDSKRLRELLGPVSIGISQFPFVVGNRYGGEASPIPSGRAYCVPAAADTDFSAPHFEISQRSGGFTVRDLSQRAGTIVNETSLHRNSGCVLADLRPGENLIIAGDALSPFRFRLVVGEAAVA